MSRITPKPGMTVEISMQGIEKSRLDAIEAAESLRKVNEAERANAELMRKEDEAGRITAEQERTMEEDARNLAESGRILAEESRVTAENLRSNSEQSRAEAEKGRSIAESGRANAEQQRVESEEMRENAEAARVTAEAARANAEALRHQTFETNEANRHTAFESAESARESEWTEIKSNVESSVGSAVASASAATDAANTAADNANAAAEKSVRYDVAQTLSDAQKAQARGNIDAADAESVDALKGDLDDIGSFVGINFKTGFVTNRGVESSQTGYKKTKLIPCYEGITITFIALTDNPDVNAISYYDENKNYISGVSNIGTDAKIEYSVTAPERTRFIKVSTTDYLLTNKKWKLSFSESPIVSKMLDDRTSFLIVDYLKADKKIGKNLFNKNSDKIIVGKYLDKVGNLLDNSSYAVSEFMPIEPNTSYAVSNSGQGGAYDIWYAEDMKTVVDYAKSIDGYTSPDNAKYLRISFVINNIDKVQVEKGETYTGYEAYTENVDVANALKNASEALNLATTHEEIFEDSRDIKNYLVWCDLYEGKKYDATGTLNNDSAFTATSITKLDRTRNLYCGVVYTSYVNFYDADKKHIEQKTFYDGTPVLAKNFPDNAEYVSFTLRTDSGLIADSPYVYTKDYGRSEVRFFRSTIKKYKGTRPVIHVYTSDSEMQIMSKMYDAFITEDCDVYFEHGTYTLNAIYDKFVEWNSNDAKELIIGGNCRYFFNGSTIIADWSSGTAKQMSNASVLGARRIVSSYELHDVTLICNGMTYVVHDEASGHADDYIRRYHNVRMIYNNGIGTNWISKCLGGGTGLNGVCIFENCTFESNAEIDNPAELSYHGASSSEDEGSYSLLISNCYFKHRISLDWLGANQKARLVFNNNSCAVLPSPNESEEANVWNVIAYNNEVHS